MDCYRCRGKDSMIVLTPTHYSCELCGYEWHPVRLVKQLCPVCNQPVLTMANGLWRCANSPEGRPGPCVKVVTQPEEELPF